MGITIVSSFRDHFGEIIDEASTRLQTKMLPSVKNYLVDILEFHAETSNLYSKDSTTLAELWLTSQSLDDESARIEKLKTLGDRALYISGFFSESLQRKLVDLDYYKQMGELAFGTLSDISRVETQGQLFKTLSKGFPRWVEVIHFVSLKSFPQSDAGILRLYEQYLKTGSELARTQLVERGVVTLSQDQLKNATQDE